MEWIDVTKDLPKSKEHVLTCSKEWGIVVKKSDINKALEVMQWKYDLEGYNVKVEAKPF